MNFRTTRAALNDYIHGVIAWDELQQHASMNGEKVIKVSGYVPCHNPWDDYRIIRHH